MLMRASSLAVLLASLESTAMAKCREKEMTLNGIIRIGSGRQVFIDAESRKEYWIEKFSDDANFPYDAKAAKEEEYPATIRAMISGKAFKNGQKIWSDSLVVIKVLKAP